MRIRIVTSFSLLLFVAAVLAHPAQAQTCPAAPADPIPRDAVRLKWVAPAVDTDAKPIVGAITYTVYELVGTAWTVRCLTTAVSAGQAGLAAGDHTYAVTAKTATLSEGARSNSATKAIPPAAAGAPTSFTIEGTVTIVGTITVTPNP